MSDPSGSSGSSATETYRNARDRLIALRGRQREAVATFRWPDLGARFNWPVDWFDVVARERAGTTALVVVEEDGSAVERTFAEMSERSDRLANWLESHGVRKADPVVVMLGNQVELWEAMLAIMKVGAVIMPTTTALGPRDLRDRIKRTGASHVICAPPDAQKFDEVDGPYTRICCGAVPGWLDMNDAYSAEPAIRSHPGTAPGDPLLLYFTSGTTSKPKLVAHTQVSYPVGHLATMYWIGLKPGDVHLNISSPGWAKHAWSCFFAPWIAEATILIYNYARFDPAALLNQMITREVTSFCAPPTVWRMMINAELGPRPIQLREVVSAGEPLNPEVIEQVRRRWDLTVRDGFGQTETSAQIGNPPDEPIKPGSMGRPLPGIPTILLDPVTGERVEGAGEGEICLDLGEGPLSLMTGYQDDPERNAEAMSGGAYHTGDVASRDGDGYLTYIGRTDDVFKASDYKISPFELESVLIEHPAVAEAAVVPAPDALRLAIPKAYVALVPGYVPDEATALDILRFARERLAPYQRIRRVEFFELPKTISGKIRRVDLRARENDYAARLEPIPTEFRDDELRNRGVGDPLAPS